MPCVIIGDIPVEIDAAADTGRNPANVTQKYVGTAVNLILTLKRAQNPVNSYHRTRETPISTSNDDHYVQTFEEKSSILRSDSCRGYEFFVDTDAGFSVIPPIPKQYLTPALHKLQSVNRTAINAYGG